MPAGPDEDTDRLAGHPDRLGGRLERGAEGRVADGRIRAVAQLDRGPRPSRSARRPCRGPCRAAGAQRPRQRPQPVLGGRGPIVPRGHDVDHHLHARADALDEVRLRDEVGPAPELEAEVGGRGRRRGRRREAAERDGQAEEQGGQRGPAEERSHGPRIRAGSRPVACRWSGGSMAQTGSRHDAGRALAGAEPSRYTPVARSPSGATTAPRTGGRRAAVALAQQAEHRIVAPKVTGSKPVGHPNPPRIDFSGCRWP